MLSKIDALFYYHHYLHQVLKLYINNFGKASWYTPQELLLKESPNRIPWQEKITDSFIIDSAPDKTLLAQDIIKRGMYFPFFCAGKYVLLGYHRLYSLKELGVDKEFLCVELNPQHMDYGTLKYHMATPLVNHLYMEIPKGFVLPGDARSDDFLILEKPQYNKDRYFNQVEVSTYRDLIDVLRMTPHMLRDEFYQYQIKPSPLVNDRESFLRWIKS